MVNRASFFATLNVFLLLALPGIKFFIFSSAVNLLVVLLLFIIIFINASALRVNRTQLVLIFLFSSFMFAIFFSGLFYDFSLDLVGALRYVSLLLSIIFVVALAPVVELKLFNMLLISWSTLLCFLYWTGLIQPTGAGELSYLILSMQLGIGYVAALGVVTFSNKLGVLRFLLPIFLLVTILTLPGRMSIILCLLMTIITLFNYIKMNIKQRKGFTIAFLFVLLFLLAIYLYPILVKYVLSDYFLYKMTLMFEGGDGRASTYLKTVQLIMDNPFGSGLQSYNSLLGYYPHNIILEAALNAGALALIPLFTIMAVFFYGAGKFIFSTDLNEKNIYSIVLVALYLFLSWNTSNNITSSYVPFTAIVLSIYYIFNSKGLKNRACSLF